MVYFFVFLVGLAIGSFITVIVYRLPRGKGFVSGHSQCPNCGKDLKWRDLVPVLSFIVLSGRCRYCRNRISWIYPIVELSSGVVVLASFLFFSSAGLVSWIFWAFILELFLTLAFIDLKYFILSDSVMVMILAAFMIYGILERKAVSVIPFMKMGTVYAFSNLASAAFLFLIFFLIWEFSKGKWIGLGDAKLAALLGLIFGLWNSVFILYLAIAAGALIGLALVFSGKGSLKTKLPLGTFIGFSTIFFVLFGQGLADKMGAFFSYLLFKIDLF